MNKELEEELEKQRVQLSFHLLKWFESADNLNEDEKEIFEYLKNYANEFHRSDIIIIT